MVFGINNAGQIVGATASYYDSYGFLYSGGTYSIPIEVGGAYPSQLHGINNKGQIIGVGLSGITAGNFLATPLVPPVAVNETASTTPNTAVRIDLTAGATGNPRLRRACGHAGQRNSRGLPWHACDLHADSGFQRRGQFSIHSFEYRWNVQHGDCHHYRAAAAAGRGG